ncbi:MAG: hypothetical protein IPL40_01920 [Proteobacteria bacterium]|nr:hypothetical protein [Pseudomonadota bacterium]
MQNKTPARALQTLVLPSTLFVSGCLPHVARRNARIEPGFDLDLTVGGGGASRTDDQRPDDSIPVGAWLNAEVDLQLGTRHANNLGYAIQLKVPLLFLLTTLDLYLELPSTSPWFYGWVPSSAFSRASMPS